ncbi:MAG: TrkH family potassium uptake protein [Bacteroidales bacterium]|nr:TrkH family potassium uptake protein [Bacteroidales bacterium]MBN2820789.1 TrkH family potassium uptake protein [Bacteroidales bacterium]
MTSIIHYGIVFKVLSRNLYIITFALLSCVAVAFIYSETFMPFAWSALIAIIIAIILSLITKKQNEDVIIGKREAYIAVTLSWAVIGLIGSLPYLFSHSIPSFNNALFESVSGFTTTGSSILTDIESLPKSILFWRSLTHWIGGIGIIVLFIIIMPTLQIGGYNLFTLESSLQEKIKPKIKSVGYRLLFIYLTLTCAEVVLLLLGKMNSFESICHAFGTIATGGFSPKNTSIADYSPYIQYVIMIFMLLAGTNFLIHYYILKRKFNNVKHNDEIKFYLGTTVIVGLILTFALYFYINKPFEEAFRESFFQLISIVTCTGYATADYLQWPVFAWTIIFFAMFLGGSTGSTAGGIKMARHLILIKNIKRIFRQLLSPHAVIPIRLNGNPVNEDTNSSILTFISIYFLVFLFGTILMVLLGIDAKTASSSVATCMAGIGPGIGTVGPASNFAHLPEVGKALLTFLMLVGRLEIYTVIMLFTRSFWSK